MKAYTFAGIIFYFNQACEAKKSCLTVLIGRREGGIMDPKTILAYLHIKINRGAFGCRENSDASNTIYFAVHCTFTTVGGISYAKVSM
jgi:hypothetical protein